MMTGEDESTWASRILPCPPSVSCRLLAGCPRLNSTPISEGSNPFRQMLLRKLQSVRERIHPGPGGKDYGTVILTAPLMVGQCVVAGLDVGRFHWRWPPPWWS
jgi:hypothetical protein